MQLNKNLLHKRKDKSNALLLIDLQNDFFPGGALGVSGAEALFPLANTLQDKFERVIATKDWHPKNHGSFASNQPGHRVFDTIELKGIPQILWPDHCVQGSEGAEFHPKLRTDKIEKIIFKGVDPKIDSYSAFFDNAHQRNTELDHYLKEHGVKTLYIMGLATDYCALYSVLDALNLGYKTYLIQDGCFGINKNPGDVDKALATMRNKGAIIIESSTLS